MRVARAGWNMGLGMQLCSICLVSAVTMSVALPTAAPAPLSAPDVGTVLHWACDGPYSMTYRVAVAAKKNGVIRYEATTDAGQYWFEQSSRFTGTTLWYRKADDQVQWFYEEDFAGLEQLVPGSQYRGAVPAQRGNEKWVWDYQISVDGPKTLEHPVLGGIMLSTVIERRMIYHGDYWSRMTSSIEPNLGITVQWIYEDPSGVERCDLVGSEHRAPG